MFLFYYYFSSYLSERKITHIFLSLHTIGKLITEVYLHGIQDERNTRRQIAGHADAHDERNTRRQTAGHTDAHGRIYVGVLLPFPWYAMLFSTCHTASESQHFLLSFLFHQYTKSCLQVQTTFVTLERLYPHSEYTVMFSKDINACTTIIDRN